MLFFYYTSNSLVIISFTPKRRFQALLLLLFVRCKRLCSSMKVIRRYEIHFVQCSYLARGLNKKRITPGSTAVSNGNENSPRWFISRFLAEEQARLSATLRSTFLCFINFRLSQSVNFWFLLKSFRMHSLIQFKRSRLLFGMMALRNQG